MNLNHLTDRHILHVDMDAFYAAVEQRDDPALRGKPVLVGGSAQARGVVSTASYEARRFGCRSAMPMAEAVRRCPQAVVLPVRMERYREVSRRVFALFDTMTPLVEPLSIDEAFLDVTDSTRLLGPAERIARDLRASILDATGLTASVGVAANKFLAKLASDLDKPDGLVVVQADRVQAMLDPLDVSRLWGVGKVTLPRFAALGLHTFGDVRRRTESALREHFGDEAGRHYYRLVRGLDDRPVTPDRQAKSISHEVTFPDDVTDAAHLRRVLLDHTDHVARRLRRADMLARTVTLKIRSFDFATITRSTTLESPTDRTDALWDATAAMFERWSRGKPPAVRLIGMGVTQLTTEAGRQLGLFDEVERDRHRALDRTVDEIRAKFGDDAVARGGTMST